MENFEKENILKKIGELKSNHEQLKNEMLKIVDAIKILDEQYNSLEAHLYKVEEEYVETIKKLI